MNEQQQSPAPPIGEQPFVRPACMDDLEALHALAGMADGVMTNLPADRGALEDRIAWSDRSFEADILQPVDEFYLLVLEDVDGQVIGAASIFSRLGAKWPFYSYKVSRVTHVSRDLDRIFSTHVLHLVNDFDGATEVGGLILNPQRRKGGLGKLLARSRYLFIALHRERFADTVIADLRGWIENGASPFWDAVPGPFFGSGFQEADVHNALYGNQFIADLMPRYPIYCSMLPKAAREAIGRPHRGSEPALHMLEAEGFIQDGYCDIFDGGPTVHARTDAIRTIQNCQPLEGEAGAVISDGDQPIAAAGQQKAFRAWLA